MPDSDAEPSRTRRRWWIPVSAVLMVLAIGAAYWQVSARAAIGDVSVVPESLVCNGRPIAYGIDTDELGDAPRPAFMLSIAPDDRCELTVAVINDSSRAVRVDSLTFPMLKPGDDSGVVIDVTTRPADGIRARSGSPDSPDAVFDIDEPIEAGEWFDWTFVVRYRVPSSTCSAGTSGSPNLPIARVSQAGASADVTGGVTLLVKSSPPPPGVASNCG